MNLFPFLMYFFCCTTVFFGAATVYLMAANELLKNKYVSNREFTQKEIVLSSNRLKIILEQHQTIVEQKREIENLTSRIIIAQNAGYTI